MSVKKFKPTSDGRRTMTVSGFDEVTRSKPERSLLSKAGRKGGRNNRGRITARHRGGGHKRRYRTIDFKRDKFGVPAKIATIEYDPNRTAYIALLHYADGEKRYILAPHGMKVGDTVISSAKSDIVPGNSLPLRAMPPGTVIHNIELKPGKGEQICRSAGSSARLSNKEEKFATLVLPSGEIRRELIECRATIGVVGNTDHSQRRLGKAGKSRHLGRRPKVRGVAMSHHDHPLGGGEGRSKGNRAPSSKSGVPSKGGPTRNRKQHSEDLIIRRRKSKRYGQLR